MNPEVTERLGMRGGRIGLTAVAVVFLLGSVVHLVSPAVSGTNVIAIAGLPFVAWALLTGPVRLRTLPTVSALALLLLLSLMAAAFLPVGENLRLVRGAAVTIVSVAGAAWFAAERSRLALRAVQVALVISGVCALLQASFLAVGVGIDPVLEDRFMDALESGIVNFGLPSIYGNPNNFSVFSGLVVLYFGLHADEVGWPWQVFAFLCVLASGSRTVFVLSLAWVGFQLVLRRGLPGLLTGVVSLAIVAGGIAATGGKSGIYVIDRTYSGVAEVWTGDVAAGSSLDVRQRSHLYFVRNYGNFLFGSFDASQPYPSFRNADFDDSLVRVNPHSLVIELHALFGLFGLLICLLLALGLALPLAHSVGGIGAVFCGATIAFYSSVPSSVLQFHVYFVLVTLIAVGGRAPLRGRLPSHSALAVRV